MDPQDTNPKPIKPGFFTDSTNLLLIAILIIILILASGIIFLVLRSNKSNSKNAKTETSQIAFPTPSQKWTRFDSSLGFSIEYPDNYTPVEDITKQTVTIEIPNTSRTDYITVTIIPSPFKNSPTGNRKIDQIQYIADWKQITLNGQTAHRYARNLCPKGCRTLAADFPYKDGTQILSITSITDDEKTFDEIVSRVKFAN